MAKRQVVTEWRYLEGASRQWNYASKRRTTNTVINNKPSILTLKKKKSFQQGYERSRDSKLPKQIIKLDL